MEERLTLIDDFKGTFWFPDDKELLFDGSVENGNLYIETADNRFHNHVGLIDESNEILFHGKTNSGRDITLIISTINTHNLNNKIFKATFYIIFIFYDCLFKSQKEISFTSIIVSFTNIEKWISTNNIIYSKIRENDFTIRVDINDEYLLYFMTQSYLKRDSFNMDKLLDVYIKLVSKKGNKSLKEWLDVKQTVQDFFNFIITGKNVLVYSIYGLLKLESSEKVIDIRFNSFVTNTMNKCTSRNPILFRFDTNEKRIQEFLNRWFRYSEDKMTYSFYFNYMYETTTFELRVFKLASFFEAFHNKYVFDKSSSQIYKEKADRKDRILGEIILEDLEEYDKKYLMDRICDISLSLKERFMELFQPFSKLISLRNPILSFTSIDEIKKINICFEPRLKEELIEIIKKKKEIDLVYDESDRNERYQKLITEIKGKCEIKLCLMYYIRIITVNILSGVASSYRNIIGHSKDEHSKIHPIKWLYMAKILEFVSQIWILRKIFNLDIEEIEETYFLGKTNPFETMIESNIQENLHKLYG